MSTAYYALFHLLVSEATANWDRPELRAILGRCSDHGPMKTASETQVSQVNTLLKDDRTQGAGETVAINLRTVANAFIQSQQKRNDADYNIEKEWTAVEVDTHIASVNEAFKTWTIIRDETAAQAYLVSLLGTKQRRPNEPRTSNAETGKRRRRPDPETPPTP